MYFLLIEVHPGALRRTHEIPATRWQQWAAEIARRCSETLIARREVLCAGRELYLAISRTPAIAPLTTVSPSVSPSKLTLDS